MAKTKMEIKTKKSCYKYIAELGVFVNKEIADEFKHLIPLPVDEKELIKHLKKKISNEDIEAQLSEIRSVTFNIAEDCNFRCRYCTYSGIYKGVRTHNTKKLRFDYAKKMINHLLKWISRKNRNVKSSMIHIGFYGGEALLEFQLIKDIMSYAQAKLCELRFDNDFEFSFRINTNGYLLDDKTVDFLVQHRITIDVSLDGPKEEHDKFRETKHGKPTWDKIWNNLTRIKARYPDYYTEKVHFLSTLHPQHDYEKIDRFFMENREYFNLERIRSYFVNSSFLKDHVKHQWRKDSVSQSSILAKRRSNERLNQILGLKEMNSETRFTGMCTLKEAKFFVSTDGNIHLCQRIRPNFSIGHVDRGVDFDAVRDLYHRWNKEILRQRCWECPAWSLCSKCLTQNEEENEIRLNCKWETEARDILTRFIEQEEEAEDDSMFENTDSVKGYISCLN